MEQMELTTPQLNIWNLQKFYEETSISNISGAVFYDEHANHMLIKQALNHLLKTQEGLRLCFNEVNGEPVQYVAAYEEQDFPEMKFESIEAFDRYAEENAKIPFILENKPLYRFMIADINGKSAVYMCINHLISDAWSISLIASVVTYTYKSFVSNGELDSSTKTYRTIIEREHKYMNSSRVRKDEDYWITKYSRIPEDSFIRPGSKKAKLPSARRYCMQLSSEQAGFVHYAEEKLNITPAVLFEAATIAYLSGINSENKQISIGIPVLNRNGVVEKGIIGMCISTIPITIDIDQHMSLKELCEKLSDEHMQIFRHQKYPYSRILSYLREKHKFVGSLFEVMVSYQNAQTGIDGSTKWYSNGFSEIPLQLHVDNRDKNDTFTLNLDYQTEVFSDTEICLVADRILTIVSKIVASPDCKLKEIPLLSEHEYDQVVNVFNSTKRHNEQEQNIHELFVNAANNNPKKVMLVFENTKFTYRQLDKMSNSLAFFLRQQGVTVGSIVPIISRRSWHVIVAMLGVLKAGGAYMPVDPTYPLDRMQYMFEIAESNLVLTYGYDEELPIQTIRLEDIDYYRDTAPVQNQNHPDDLCYVIFTSGSTGKPKGVSITHRNVVNYCNNNSNNNVCHSIIETGHDSIVSVTNFIFDIFVTESLLPLLNNITIYFANDEEVFSQKKLSRLICDNPIDVMQTTPTKMRSYMFDKDNIEYLSHLKVIVLGGEAFPEDLYKELRAYTNARIFNIYGPAETTVWSTNKEILSYDKKTEQNICVHELFENQAKLTPEKIAVLYKDSFLTYRQLNEFSNGMASLLQRRGICQGDIVPVISTRVCEVVISIIGILKAGAIYMPIDHSYPHERINSILESVNPKLILYHDTKCDYSYPSLDICGADYDEIYEYSKIKVSIDSPCYIINTSGTTGKPKQIVQTHRCMTNLLKWQNTNYPVEGEIVGATTIFSFDVSIQEILYGICFGGILCLSGEETKYDIKQYIDFLQKNKISMTFLTPSYFNAVLPSIDFDKILSLKYLFFSGENFSIQEETLRKVLQRVEVVNQYGPAESHVATNKDITLTDKIDITIGKPILNTQVYILDQNQRLLPCGVAGELCIAGAGVGKGYLNRPDLTAERFIANPFSTKENGHGVIMYRTGDLARWRVDGELEYLGRIDTQVKIRGLRIELGEIESCMLAFAGIKLAAVTDKKDDTGRQYLVGYYISDEELNEKEIRKYLSSKLPKYMVPNYIMRLDTMPMTASGKTDRKNLPVPEFTKDICEYVEPIGKNEKILAQIWSELLKVDNISRKDNFSDLGGDSLLAIQLLSRIETDFGVTVSIKDILNSESLETMAGLLATAKQRTYIEVTGRKSYRLLPQQLAIYAACRKNPESVQYNLPACIPLPETIDREKLNSCFQRLLNVHPELLSHVETVEGEIRMIFSDEQKLVIDSWEENNKQAFVRPFLLEKGPLIRVAITESSLLVDMHHIIADGLSLDIILRDLESLYEGKLINENAVSYADYASFFETVDFSRGVEFFKNMLKCDFEPISLPESKHTGRTGGVSRFFTIDDAHSDIIKNYAHANRLTETMVLFGAYGILLSKYSNNKDILTSIVMSNRSHTEVLNTVGMFVNTIPVYMKIDGTTREYYHQIQAKIGAILENQEMPFGMIADAVGIADKNVINTSFVYQGDGEKEIVFDGITCAPEWMETRTSKFDLTFEITPVQAHYNLRVEYDTSKYEDSLVDRLFVSLVKIFDNLETDQVKDIDVIAEDEKQRILFDFNNTAQSFTDKKCVHELFEEEVIKNPNKVMLVFEGREFTYRQLDEMSNSLAHYLSQQGITAGSIVPIISRRSWHVIVAMLGVLKAGGAYMPVDPTYPPDRMQYMFETAENTLALTYGYDEELPLYTIKLEDIDFYRDIEPVQNQNHPDDLCYVIFTSGSTGKPKGVSITHKNVVNYCNNNKYNVCNSIIQAGHDSIVSVTNIIFDIFVTESLLPLLNSITIYFANDDEVFSQKKLSRLISTNPIDVMQTTPTKMRSYMLEKDNVEYLSHLKAIVLGGEAFPEDLCKELRFYTNARIFNIYGPAETTVWSTNKLVENDVITIGKPIANTQIYILNNNQRLFPCGVAGELCIAGDGVGKGYLNRPDLTAERFIPNPYATKENGHGTIIYRTGDLARWRVDGEIEYLGRIDTQVKIRGLRIELGEIESCLVGFEGIKHAAVTDKKDDAGRQYLVGYYISDDELDEKEIRKYLLSKLPKYMVPNYIMRLDMMPMTSSGKTDRKNLPVPVFTKEMYGYVEPIGQNEIILAQIWSELLKVDKISRKDNFVDLGGDSLLAIQLLSRIENDFEVTISIKDILNSESLEAMADLLAVAEQKPHIEVTGRKSYRLLPQQLAIYAACRKNPDSVQYNLPACIPLPETVDREKLNRCFQQLIAAHPELTSHVETVEGEIWITYDNNQRLVIDSWEENNKKAFVRPFRLEKGPLIRVAITESSLLVDLHHIIADGLSLDIILRDLESLYEGNLINENAVSYADYASFFETVDFSRGVEFFKNMLKCDFEPVSLPESKHTGKTGGVSRFFTIDDAHSDIIKNYAHANRLTETMVLFGAYGILLSKYSNNKDILTSIVMSNRSHAEVKNTVGMFVNTLPVYLQVDGTTKEYYRQIKAKIGALLENQEMPFGMIADAVGIVDKNIINTSFVYQGDGEKEIVLDGITCVPEWMETGTSKFDLTFEITPMHSQYNLRVEYDTSKYEDSLVDKLFVSLLKIIDNLEIDEETSIDVIAEEEKQRILFDFNNAVHSFPYEKCVHELFEEEVVKNPNRVMLVFEGRGFTYRQLDKMSNSLAHYLIQQGVTAGTIVPIISRRSWHVIVAMLGVLKAGGAYMPVDPTYPLDRMQYMFETAQSALVLTYGYDEKLPIHTIRLEDIDFYKDSAPVQNRNHPDDLCYVIFTSGSTGKPKGVSIMHKNVVNYCNNNNNNNVCHSIIEAGHDSIVSVTNIIFDIFVTESLLPLLNSITIYFANDEEVFSQKKLSRLISTNPIDVMQTTPTKMRSYMIDKDNIEYLSHLKAIVLGGEAFPVDLYKELRTYTNARIFNIYGPAETTVWSTNKFVENDVITIGKPIANTQIYILDSEQRLLPVDVAGELCIAGAGVGKGYLNRADLTAERFIPNPFSTEENGHGSIMYRTGDLARWREDGEIEYLGRIDTQVKIRGLRIELGEIESVLVGYPGVKLAAVTDKKDDTGRQYLVGYYTSDDELDEKDIRNHLASKLPKYMVPNYIMRLDTMPMTVSGKTDRKNLPVPDFTDVVREYMEPSNDTEKILCELMASIFNLNRVGITEDFFELGGDSLKAIEFVAKAHNEGVDFALQNVFDYPTARSLCTYIQEKKMTQSYFAEEQFEKYKLLLEKNVIDETFVSKRKKLGNVLLTGATGFLGAHILDAYIRNETGTLYCLVRGGSERLKNTLRYYFEDKYEGLIGSRIIPIEGDITDPCLSDKLSLEIDAIIHAAATVKHYGKYEDFYRVNVEGTDHVIEAARKLGTKLIHISTGSVGGDWVEADKNVEVPDIEKVFDETCLFIDQPLSNVYIRSKFEAEFHVLDALLEGVDAKIIRVGNLTNRSTDFKFQPNFESNAFLKRMKAALEFGMMPEYLAMGNVEFSAINETAEGILSIAEYAPENYTVFHLSSDRQITLNRLSEMLKNIDISLRLVPSNEFEEALAFVAQQDETRYIYEAFLNDMGSDGKLVYDNHIHFSRDFTSWFMSKIGFHWSEITQEYIDQYISYFRKIGYLK